MDLVRALDPRPNHTLVAADAPAPDAAWTRPADLAALVARQVAARFAVEGREGQDGRVVRSHPSPVGLASARSEAAAERALLHLQIRLDRGKIQVTADLYPVPRTIWSRVANPAPASVAHAFAEAPIDAEIRSFLPAIPLVASSEVSRGRGFESDVVAAACGDLDRDGSLVIATVSRRRVTTIRIREGKVVPLRSRSWPELSPSHPAPLREPIAFATIAERETGDLARVSTLDVSLTDRAKSVRLDGVLDVTRTFPGLAVPDGRATGCAKILGFFVTGLIVSCAPEDPAPAATMALGSADAFASAALVAPDGAPFTAWASRERGRVLLRDSSGKQAHLSQAGAQIALGDLDQDGDPEVLTSADTLNAADDAVVVSTWRRATGAIEERERIAAPAGVHALAICPPDSPDRAPFVVATADEVWVVRQKSAAKR